MDNSAYEVLLQKNRELQEQLQFYKDYDLLTGLYNKNAFYQSVEEKLALYPKLSFQIICVDVERFKLVNDLYGTEQGDLLLQYLAERIKKEFTAEKNSLGRIGADIFAVFLTDKEGGKLASDKIQAIFREYTLSMEIVPAIGIYCITNRDKQVSLMCDHAIMALNSIKGNYLKHVAFYDNRMRNMLVEEQELLNGVEDALKNKEFEVYLQPKCNMHTGKITGAEALVRWNHPQKGMIPPNDFIPIFERNGFIKKLDQYVWEETAAWLHHWAKSGQRPLPISVNISRIDIAGLDVCNILLKLVEKYELELSWLELEITESAYSSRTDEIITVINRLMKCGFTVLMDDFGSGYSSLNILKDISIDVLKLDMRFLDNDDRRSKDILESVVHMAKWLNLKVIAEGVENCQQRDFLLEIGCIYAQGYYYYRPMPLNEYEQLLYDTDNLDFSDAYLQGEEEQKKIKFRDLLHGDMVSDVLLNHILGAVVLYSYDGEKIQILCGNEEYYKMMDCADDVLNTLLEEDRQVMYQAIKEAKSAGDNGVEVTFRRGMRENQLAWYRMRLFFLSAANGNDIFYASLSDVTDYMNAIQGQKIAEQRTRIVMEFNPNEIFEVDFNRLNCGYAKHSMDKSKPGKGDIPEGLRLKGTIYPGDEEKIYKIYEEVCHGKERASCVIRIRTDEGSVVWNRITLTAIQIENTKTIKAVGMVEEIT